MEKLSLRLQTIFNMVDAGSVVADVGSDHGKLMISLYEKGIISCGFAIENKKGPFSRLKEAIINSGADSVVTPILSDGIRDLPETVDTVVIAGMGGTTIWNIISSHLERINNVKTFIIDAHSLTPMLRKEISNLGYKIVKEEILKEDNIFYEIVRFDKGETPIYSKDDLEYGPILRKAKSDVFIDKYQSRINEIDVIFSRNIPEEARIKYLNEKNKLLEVIK